MRGLHYGVVAAAVVGLAATAVGSAFGAGGIVKAPTVGGGPIAKICGDLPTRAQCLDSSYLELCGARNSAVCAPTVVAAFEAAWLSDTAPTKTVIFDGISDQAKLLPATSVRTISTVPNTGTRYVDALIRDSASIFALDPARSKHAAWESSSLVRSCGEYVFKKFYDYNRIEDAVNAYGSDYEAVYSLVTSGAADIQPLKMTGGENAFRTLKDKEGTPLSFQRLEQSGHYHSKNAFFMFEPGFLKLVPEYKTDPAYKTYVDALVAHIKRGERGAPYGYAATDGWTFDRTLHDKVAGYNLSAQAQARIDEHNQRYFNLVSDFFLSIALEQAEQDMNTVPVNKLFPGLGSLVKGNPVAPSGFAPTPTIDPTPLAIQGGGIFQPPNQVPGQIGGQTNGVLVSDLTLVGSLTQTPSATAASPTGLTMAGAGGGTTLMNVRSGPGAGSPSPSLIGAGGLITSAVSGIKFRVPTVGKGDSLSGFCASGVGCDRKAIVAAMAQMLQDEWNRPAADSCFNLDRYQCDWTARSFAKRWPGLYEEREGAYARCVQITGAAGTFTKFQVPEAIQAAGLASFDNFLVETAKTQHEIKNAIHIVDGDAAHPNKVVRGSTGGDRAGWETVDLVAGYTYDVGWMFYVPKPADDVAICKMGAEAHAIGKVYVDTPITDQIDFLDSDSSIEFFPDGGGVVHSHTIVLGKQLYTSIPATSFATDWSPEPASLRYTLFNWKIPFPIGPFVVKVGIGASTVAGFEAGAGFKAAAENCDVTRRQLIISAHFTPKGSVEVDASLSAGLPGVQLGVEGHVGVLGVGVPWKITATLDAEQIKLSDDVRLRFSALGGSADVFAEVGECPVCKKWSKNVLSWEGLSTETDRLYGNDYGPWEMTALRPLLH